MRHPNIQSIPIAVAATRIIKACQSVFEVMCPLMQNYVWIIFVSIYVSLAQQINRLAIKKTGAYFTRSIIIIRICSRDIITAPAKLYRRQIADIPGVNDISPTHLHDEPILADDVVHYAVGNIPGAVPHTSTYALTNATLRYIVTVADEGPQHAITAHPELAAGVNVVGDMVCHPAVAASLGADFVQPAEALAGV